MDVFSYDCYREVLKSAVETRKPLDSTMTFQAMAQRCRIAKSYLSKALTGKAELSTDQVELACEFLNLTAEETDFVHLLHMRERTCLGARKTRMDQKLTLAKKQHLDTKKHLLSAKNTLVKESLLETYYLDPYHQLIHITFSIARYKANPKKAADLFSIHPDKFHRIIQNLERMGLIRVKSGRVEMLQENLHLPKESKLFQPWMNQLKLLGLQKLNQLNTDSPVSYCAIFTSDQQGRDKIHSEFLSFLKKAEKIAEQSPSEHTYQLSVDLIPWT